ncbi:DUF2997 domain-containing protein [Paenibacillus cymbidii]|uniref:DUF2997 domain-containing protein n=1 Tax=Paenibacillus cymbidii TaxID=1639034 RepID=UPI0010817B93|nr:DUF2997 domain-containing protein [Paenibacillus cymbidii]
MSHCTTFQMTFQDKRMLFRAMRGAGLNPENRIWESYDSGLQKRLGVGGELIGKLLTGERNGIQLFFMETAEGLRPYVESDRHIGEELDRIGQDLLSSVQKSYLELTVEAAVRQIRQAGIAANANMTMTNDSLSYVITLGDPNKTVTVSLRNDGSVEEQVRGIEGRSCTDVSGILERAIATPEQLTRSWNPEYNATIEDRVVQVLRLSR